MINKTDTITSTPAIKKNKNEARPKNVLHAYRTIDINYSQKVREHLRHFVQFKKEIWDLIEISHNNRPIFWLYASEILKI